MHGQRCLRTFGLYKDQVPALLIKKADMTQDFVQTLEGIPFLYLRVKGELNVSDILRMYSSGGC